ncbi:hypothetical protein IJF81_01045 [bacterium]|nr:hypothetical protein [bacterium]
MKNKLLLILSMAVVLTLGLQANAELTTADTSSGDYLINTGYSAVTGEMVERCKGYANGVPYVTEAEQNLLEKTPWERFLIKLHSYIDPGMDSDTFLNHDVRISPSVNDL